MKGCDMHEDDAQLISIYMPTYNREKLAIRAITSVINQNYKNWELFIVDDMSDSTMQIEHFINSLHDPRITLLINEKKHGACYSRNRAISLAKGTFLTGIDDDDEWLDHRLQAFMTNISRLEMYSFLYADDFFCEGDKIIQKELPIYKKPKYKTTLLYKRNIIGNQVFSYKERFQNLLFDENLPAAQDYDLFMRMILEYGKPFKIDTVSQVLYVNHGAIQITNSKKKFSGYFKFYQKHKIRFDKSSRKYQLFSLYQVRNKQMSMKTKLILLTFRNLKKIILN